MNTHGYFFRIFGVPGCRCRYLLLAFCCLAGALSGICVTRFSEASFLSLTHRVIHSSVSVVGLIACNILPFLFAAIAVFLSCRWALYPICFVEFFLHCWFAFGVMTVDQTSGWLLRLLLQFSDGCLLPMLCWFSLRHVSDCGSHWKQDFCLCLLAVLMAGIFDICVITPFLASLINI